MVDFCRYGSTAQVLVTSNLTGWVSYLESTFVVANCGSTIAPLIAVISDVVEEVIRRDPEAGRDGSDDSDSESEPSVALQLAVRTTVFALAIAVAVVTYDNLNNLESLIGGIGSMVTSLIMPSLCYLRLCWKGLSVLQRTVNVSIACLGIVASFFIVISNVAGVT